jgi:hypothetical protein
MYLVLLLTALTTVMGVTVNMNNSVQEHLLGAGCTDTNKAITVPAGGGYQVYCTVSSGTHSFTIRNTPGFEISYFSADGPSCDAITNGNFDVPFYQSYSVPYPAKTTSSLITVTGAPCSASPCCFVVVCVNLLGCPLNFDYSWTASTAAVANSLGTIIGAVVGVLVFLICGSVSYCRYKHTCCFKSKSVSIPVDAMRRSDGTLIVNNKV